ncbi:hypothetical protein [Saccharospirillum salsuginis]|uniref:hypothetical protein n=1 Tax=Saccharospirillum salsuginis TaxID=418750 RepID=UPI0016763126|nr:hypothetical protein [Saccharospirillum salsuginis]
MGFVAHGPFDLLDLFLVLLFQTGQSLFLALGQNGQFFLVFTRLLGQLGLEVFFRVTGQGLGLDLVGNDRQILEIADILTCSCITGGSSGALGSSVMMPSLLRLTASRIN